MPFVTGAAFGALAVRRLVAAIHPAIAVAVGATVALLLAALRLAGLGGGVLLVLTMLGLAMLLMLVVALLGRRRRGLRGGRGRDDEHRGGEKIFHHVSP